MPTFKDYTRKNLDLILSRIQSSIYEVIAPLEIAAWRTPEPQPFFKRTDGELLQLKPGDSWGGLFDCAWFHFIGTVPAAATDKHIVLLIDINGELCIVDAQGVPLRGLTNMASMYDLRLGSPGKHIFQITPSAVGNEKIDIWADAGCNDLFGNLSENGTIKEAQIAICNDNLRQLYYDFEVLLDLTKVLPEDSPRKQQLLTALNDAAHLLAGFTEAEARMALEILQPHLTKKNIDPPLKITAIGHAHLDLAWMWPLRESIRKGARTFATALDLIQRYPDYIFGASQPQLFQWMKDDYPDLYSKIKTHVQQGRIDVQGAMWVEADTNITSGESLVRQILYGKRFFKDEFGIDMNYLWLPDVFGYNAALPQILKKSGVDYFMTQKLSWSLINNFPTQSFHWYGIDGTSVLTHMLPEETYNSAAAPNSIRKAEQQYKEKGVSEFCLMLYGIGDGGGGPGAEHLERLDREKDLAGLPPVKQELASAFFPKWAQAAEKFPKWVGELYLERHQGTFTTQARNKFYNRKMEFALRDWEWYAMLAEILGTGTYPSERLQTIWREILLYQFHDILPGSSIKRVYDESVERYQLLLSEINEAIISIQTQIARRLNLQTFKKPLVIFNSLSWSRSEWIFIEDSWLQVQVPGMGFTTVELADMTPVIPQLKAENFYLENELLILHFAANGSIESIWDKTAEREIIPDGHLANRFAVYDDDGDAWDFRMDYADYPPRYMELVAVESHVNGPQATLKQTYRLGSSELVQKIILTAECRRIDFKTHLHWREIKTMLRTSFPVEIHAESANFDIQFGHIVRTTHQNTSWDLARDEVPAQKWVDLSQRDYGVALLNDSKYGYKVKGNVLDLNLLRSVPYTGQQVVKDEDVLPGEPHHAYSDQYDHQFTYALFPHPGDHIVGNVVQTAYELNVPLQTRVMPPGQGDLNREMSFFRIEAPNIIVETVKKAEDEQAMIIRMYESTRSRTRTSLQFFLEVEQVEEVNLMETGQAQLRSEKVNHYSLEFQPFEIKTVRVKLAINSI